MNIIRGPDDEELCEGRKEGADPGPATRAEEDGQKRRIKSSYLRSYHLAAMATLSQVDTSKSVVTLQRPSNESRNPFNVLLPHKCLYRATHLLDQMQELSYMLDSLACGQQVMFITNQTY